MKKLIFTLALTGLLGLGAFANDNDSTKTISKNANIKEVVTLQEFEDVTSSLTQAIPKKLEVRIINAEGKVLYARKVKSLEFIEDGQLRTKLRNCDFVIETGGIAYYLKG